MFHAVQVDPGQRRIWPAGQAEPFRPQLPCQALGVLLHLFAIGKQGLPAEQDLLGPVGDAEAQFLRGVPPGAEAQQGLLPDPAVDPGIADQTMGLARTLVGARASGPDEDAMPPSSLEGKQAG